MPKSAMLYRKVTPHHICPFGLKSRWLLRKQGYQVNDHVFVSNAEADTFMQEQGVDTTPQTFIDGKRIGGYGDLLRFFGETDPQRASGTTYQPVIAVFATALLMALALISYEGFALYSMRFLIAFISIKEHPERYHVGIRNDSFTTLNHDNSVEYSDTDWEVSKALQSKTFYAITAVILMGSFTYSTILPQIIVHLGVEGISMRDASLALSLLAILGMTGKLVFGYAAEIIGSRYALIICLLGQSLFSVLMLKSSNPLI